MEKRKGISFRGYIPLRSKPEHMSEMVSQVLFGETFRIMEEKGNWALISLDFDHYEGWVERGAISVIKSENEPETEGISETGETCLVAKVPLTILLDVDHGGQLILPSGSIWLGSTGNASTIHGRRFEILSNDDWIKPGPENDPEEIGNWLISVPYLWGGRSGFGFDCSGLVQHICRMLGIDIPRDSKQQAEMGSTINFMNETRKGDLAFFQNRDGEIAHVGMILDGGRVLHSYNQVRIDKLDQQGIFSSETDSYTHKLRIIKRISA